MQLQRGGEAVHGTNAQFLLGKVIRLHIHDSQYWMEQCFGLSAEGVAEKAAALTHIGGTFGGNRTPTPFLCLLYKLLQIQPDFDIMDEFLNNEDFKYLRALGAFYVRMTGKPEEVYRRLEPLYVDYRKLRYRSNDGRVTIIHMDEFIDRCLVEPVVCEVDLPALPKRFQLEESGRLEPYVSILDEDGGLRMEKD